MDRFGRVFACAMMLALAAGLAVAPHSGAAQERSGTGGISEAMTGFINILEQANRWTQYGEALEQYNQQTTPPTADTPGTPPQPALTSEERAAKLAELTTQAQSAAREAKRQRKGTEERTKRAKDEQALSEEEQKAGNTTKAGTHHAEALKQFSKAGQAQQATSAAASDARSANIQAQDLGATPAEQAPIDAATHDAEIDEATTEVLLREAHEMIPDSAINE